MIAELVSFSDITKLARLSHSNQHLEFLDAVIEIQSKYSFESLNPVLKAVFYANVGKPEKKILNKWMHMASTFKKYEFYSPYSSKCYPCDSTIAREIDKQENITGKVHVFSNFCDIKENNLKVIPRIIHNIWILSSTLQNSNLQLKTFNNHHPYQESNYNLTSTWEHYMWLTHPDAITVTLQNKISETNYTIKYISDLADTAQRAFLVSSALTFAEFGYYTFTSDILRYVVLSKYGGVYLDGDYKIYHGLDKLVDSFSSVVGYQAPARPCSSFIAMSQQHYVSQKAIDLLSRNLNLTDAPEYVKYPCSKGAKLFATDAVFTVSRALVKEQLNNETDLLLRPGIVSEYNQDAYQDIKGFGQGTYASYGENCRESFMETDIGIIGKDDLHGSWKNDLEDNLDYQ